jgi:hypothetical protein
LLESLLTDPKAATVRNPVAARIIDLQFPEGRTLRFS